MRVHFCIFYRVPAWLCATVISVFASSSYCLSVLWIAWCAPLCSHSHCSAEGLLYLHQSFQATIAHVNTLKGMRMAQDTGRAGGCVHGVVVLK